MLYTQQAAKLLAVFPERKIKLGKEKPNFAGFDASRRTAKGKSGTRSFVGTSE
jgi:hypothetical protein